VDDPVTVEPADFDPGCYLCPGNERAGGQRNPDYSGGFSFENDFPALSPESDIEPPANPLFVAQPESGYCRVVCFSEKHQLRLAKMDKEEAAQTLELLFAEFKELDQRPDIGYVQVFENRGQMMGCSNPHPHAQVWATRSIPVEPSKELDTQSAYYAANGRPLLVDYLESELEAGERLVCRNEHAVALVPFWACWPYETLLLPCRPVAGPGGLSKAEIGGLAQVLRQTLLACERLFCAPVPYSMGFHPRPSDGAEHPEWQFHAHIYPPLLRSASVRKHMVGFEMLGTPQRDLTPEAAAKRLCNALKSSERI